MGKSNEKLLNWTEIMAYCHSNTSIPAIHTQFDAFENAKELWNFLSTRFKSVGLAHYYQLHNSLVNLNQEVGQLVNEYLAVLQPIWTQLDQAKISKDHLRLIKVLMGLRPEYESVRAAYYIAVPCHHWMLLSKKYYLKKNIIPPPSSFR
uniref:UBN2_3 domain-containing protein n=1 Tax=Cucumis melo TaxID=3656 RepID=A0A9I9ELD2_CUCME